MILESKIVGGGLRSLTKGRLSANGLSAYIQNGWVEIALNILGFISGIILARFLGPTGRGQLASAVMWPTFIGILTSLGLHHALVYAAATGWASPARLRRLTVRYTLAVGFPIMIIYWLLCPWILGGQFFNEIWIPRLFAPFIPLTLYVGFLLAIFQGCGDFTLWNIARTFRVAAWAGCIVFFSVVWKLSVTNLLIVQLIILVVTAIYLGAKFNNLKDRSRVGGPVTTEKIFKYGFAVYISSLAFTANQQLDQLLLSVYVVPADLGQYTSAASLSNMILIVSSAIGPIAFSKVAQETGNYADQYSHVKLVLLVSFILLVASSLVLMLLAPWVTWLFFGEAYAMAGKVLQILAPAAALLGMGGVLNELLKGVGAPKYSAYGATFGAVITIGGLILVLPRYGIWGAAWVSFTAYAAMVVIQAGYLLKWSYASSSISVKPEDYNIGTVDQ